MSKKWYVDSRRGYLVGFVSSAFLCVSSFRGSFLEDVAPAAGYVRMDELDFTKRAAPPTDDIPNCYTIDEYINKP